MMGTIFSPLLHVKGELNLNPRTLLSYRLTSVQFLFFLSGGGGEGKFISSTPARVHSLQCRLIIEIASFVCVCVFCCPQFKTERRGFSLLKWQSPSELRHL